MNRGLQVFLVCAVGAFIGTLIALQVAPWLMWLGPTVGGSFAYLAYDFKAVRKAAPLAWRKTRHTIRLSPLARLKLLYYTLTSLVSVSWLIICLAILYKTNMNSSVAMLSIVFAICIGAIGVIVFGYVSSECISNNDFHEAKDFLLAVNPIGAILGVFFGLGWCGWKLWGIRRSILPGLLKFLVNCLGVSWDIICCFGRFLHNLFRLVHSDLRLLCFVDAAIGAAIGFFFGNAIVGLLVGGPLGWLNFEIISKRVLKVVPVRVTA